MFQLKFQDGILIGTCYRLRVTWIGLSFKDKAPQRVVMEDRSISYIAAASIDSLKVTGWFEHVSDVQSQDACEDVTINVLL